MVKIYYAKIIKGDITIDEVPAKWRSQVEELLQENIKEEIYVRPVKVEEPEVTE